MNAPRYFAGCMTGTSLDGMDSALVEIQGHGLDMTVESQGMLSASLGPLRQTLLQLAEGGCKPAIAYMRAARRLGQLHAELLCGLCRKHLPKSAGLEAIAAHGQTIWHQPEEGLSWQLLDPWPIVRALQVPVCFDLRQADLVAGGQGAPMTPLADHLLYRRARPGALIVNLGGICNVTLLGQQPEACLGRDIAPCNLLIDGMVQRLFPGQAFDTDGQIAACGQPSPRFRHAVGEHPFFRNTSLPRSTGREQFGTDWLEDLLTQVGADLSPQDTIASATDTVGWFIGQQVATLTPSMVVLAGGGTLNPMLVEAIRRHIDGGCQVLLSDELGIPATAREALAVAVLGALSRDGVPITLTQVTGADHPGRGGSWALP